MDHGVLVYKVDKSYTVFSIEFSYINSIQGSIHWPTLRSLSHNKLGLGSCSDYYT